MAGVARWGHYCSRAGYKDGTSASSRLRASVCVPCDKMHLARRRSWHHSDEPCDHQHATLSHGNTQHCWAVTDDRSDVSEHVCASSKSQIPRRTRNVSRSGRLPLVRNHATANNTGDILLHKSVYGGSVADTLILTFTLHYITSK